MSLIMSLMEVNITILMTTIIIIIMDSINQLYRYSVFLSNQYFNVKLNVGCTNSLLNATPN